MNGCIWLYISTRCRVMGGINLGREWTQQLAAGHRLSLIVWCGSPCQKFMRHSGTWVNMIQATMEAGANFPFTPGLQKRSAQFTAEAPENWYEYWWKERWCRIPLGKLQEVSEFSTWCCPRSWEGASLCSTWRRRTYMEVSINGGTPNGWFIMENATPPFRKPPYS